MSSLTVNQEFMFALCLPYSLTKESRIKDLSWVGSSIEDGANVNARLDELVKSRLVNDNEDLVQHSLSLHPNSFTVYDIQPKLSLGMTPLHIAVEDNAVASVQYLLEINADPSCKDDAGRTPLFSAKSLEVFKMLMNYGAPIGDQDNEEMTVMDHYYLRSHAWDIISPEALQECYSNFCKVICEGLRPLLAEVTSKLVISYLAPYDHIREGVSHPKSLALIKHCISASHRSPKVQERIKQIWGEEYPKLAIKLGESVG